MFDSKQTLTNRLANATDLLIDFATLGEYGLEPVGRARQGCADSTPTRRQLPPRATTRGAQCDLLSEAGFKRSIHPKPRATRRRHTVDGPFLLRP
ncbi:MAG TPA: hypothetical protein VFX85_04720 [Solirubrobacterales bacterium]|nr:hypothetical protein [Solirubrobacterales bacterium]